MEVLSQMDLACDLEYITKEEFNIIEVMVENVGRPLSGLKKYFDRKAPLTSNLMPLTSNLNNNERYGEG